MANPDLPPEGTLIYFYNTNWPKAEAIQTTSDVLYLFNDEKFTKYNISENNKPIRIGKGFCVTLKKRRLWKRGAVPKELWIRWAVEIKLVMPANPERSSHYGFSDEF